MLNPSVTETRPNLGTFQIRWNNKFPFCLSQFGLDVCHLPCNQKSLNWCVSEHTSILLALYLGSRCSPIWNYFSSFPCTQIYVCSKIWSNFTSCITLSLSKFLRQLWSWPNFCYFCTFASYLTFCEYVPNAMKLLDGRIWNFFAFSRMPSRLWHTY